MSWGVAGRKILEERLPEIQQEYEIEFTIVNVENAAGGFGITPSVAEKILGYGVDVMTSGNHIWDKKEVFEYFDRATAPAATGETTHPGDLVSISLWERPEAVF